MNDGYSYLDRKFDGPSAVCGSAGKDMAKPMNRRRMDLSEHMKETADRLAGYTTGTLIVEDGTVSLQRADGELLPLDNSYVIEVRNSDVYEAVTLEQALEWRTAEGWPLLGGLYARAKNGRNRD